MKGSISLKYPDDGVNESFLTTLVAEPFVKAYSESTAYDTQLLRESRHPRGKSLNTEIKKEKLRRCI